MTLIATGPTLHASRTLPCSEPLDVGLTFGPVAHTLGWASSHVVGDEWWHTMNTPDGAVSLCVRVDRADAAVTIHAWGPGCSWVVDHARRDHRSRRHAIRVRAHKRFCSHRSNDACRVSG